MHKHAIAVGFALVLIVFLSAHAQDPTIAVYFDEAMENQTTECPGYNAFDTLYIVAENFPKPVQGIEYKIDYQAWLIFYLDESTTGGGFAIGDHDFGISIVWPTPQDFSSKGLLQRVVFLWQCYDCESMVSEPFVARPSEDCDYGQFMRAVNADLSVTVAVGDTSWVCPTVTGVADPTPPNTWGRIKALYED